jgi:hypothetical protein
MNYVTAVDGLLWLLTALVIFMLLQRVLHREIQAFFLILTRRPQVTQVIFALIFFPGVLLHESSHFLAAKILGVRTGNFSLIPQAQPNGKLRLGYVETYSGGFLRDALVGAAPLVTGCAFVALVSIHLMHLLPLWEVLRTADWNGFWAGLAALPKAPDFWLWFYLVFTVSSTMMPSASDRQTWLPVGLLALGFVGLALLAGAGPWLMSRLAPGLNNFLRALALIFTLSGVLHVLLILPFLLLHKIMAKIMKMDVE